MSGTIVDSLAAARIVPVVEIVDAETAVPLAETLADAGLPMMEVTLRTRDAIDAISRIAAALPEFLVGAGTLVVPSDVEAAAEAGAKFGVSPGFTPTLSAAAASHQLPFVPGAVTASEILSAVESGHRDLKFFPAERSGGSAVLKAFQAPFAALGIRFMPTGGVTRENIRDYLALDTVFAVGGTWIAPRDRIAASDFDTIRATAAEAVATVATELQAAQQ